MNFSAKLTTFSLILAFFLAACLDVFAGYQFDSWTTDNGLPQNGIRQIAQTPDGYLWFTTFDGLVRFDGVRFTTFGKGNTAGILNNRFTDLYCGTDGTLYATTMEDGVLTIYRNGVFTSFDSKQVPDQYIKLIRPDENDELRFLTEDHDPETESWYYLRDGQFVLSEKRIKASDEVLFRGSSGTLWTITPAGTTAESDGKATYYQHPIKQLDVKLEFFEDSTGALWISGTELTRLKDGRIDSFGENDGFPPNADFHKFWEESDGSIWFANGGPSGHGLGLVRYQDGKFSIYGSGSGLSDTSIYDVFKDREGIVWLATNKGLNRMRKKILTAYNKADGLDNSEVYPLYRDSSNTIWIGTVTGLNTYKNGQFEEVELVQGREDVPEHTQWKNGEVSIQSIFEDSLGKMWIGVSGGIFVVDNGRAEMIPESEGHHVFSILQGAGGSVWAATNRGILRFDDYKLRTRYTVKDGLPNDFMTVIFNDQGGRLWFGGLGGLTEFRDGRFINYSTSEGLAGNYVRTIYEDKDHDLWIGTYDEGLSRMRDGRFVNYTSENGLFNNGVFAIEEDTRGNFWISSNRGIYRVSRSELNDFADGRVSKIHSVGYGKEDGMLNNECNGGRQPASIRDADGNFWFPTQDGVVVIDPSIETKNTLPPSVVIESAMVERELINLGDDGIVIEAGQKNIELRFTGISLIKSDQIKFKYRLEGHDADWIDADTMRTAYYSYLPPGAYRFHVIAANSDGIWNTEGAAIELELKPFFYQTTSFYLMCAALGILALLGVWQISVFQLRSRARLLKKLVAERTAELRDANLELQHLANIDGLTGVSNRRRFEEFLADEWLRAVRANSDISLILLDIDHFKLFNDTYGHQAGDETLRRVAGALIQTVRRPADLAARFGGEEFAIVLGETDLEGAMRIGGQIAENIANLRIPHSDNKTGGYLTVSMGIATVRADQGINESDLIGAADNALYRAKNTGRNRIESHVFSHRVDQNAILEDEYSKTL